MKKFIFVALLAFVGIGASCGKNTPGIFTLYAQSLPITKTCAWDTNPPTEAISNYTVRLDGVVIGNPTGLSQQFTITTPGAHVLSVTATNMWETSNPSVLNFNVVVPTPTSNVRIQ